MREKPSDDMTEDKLQNIHEDVDIATIQDLVDDTDGNQQWNLIRKNTFYHMPE